MTVKIVALLSNEDYDDEKDDDDEVRIFKQICHNF